MDKEKLENAMQMIRMSRVKLQYDEGFLDWLVNDFAINNSDASNEHFPGLLKDVIENTMAVASAKERQKNAVKKALGAVAITKIDEGYRVKGDISDLTVLLQAVQNVMEDDINAKLKLAPKIDRAIKH